VTVSGTYGLGCRYLPPAQRTVARVVLFSVVYVCAFVCLFVCLSAQ